MNKEIFREENIQTAINAYKKIAQITYVENNVYWILEFRKCKYDEQVTEHEFENYLIGLEC